jgi:hypothetical protein
MKYSFVIFKNAKAMFLKSFDSEGEQRAMTAKCDG